MVDRADVEVEAEEKMSDIEVAARIMLRIDGVVTPDIDPGPTELKAVADEAGLVCTDQGEAEVGAAENIVEEFYSRAFASPTITDGSK